MIYLHRFGKKILTFAVAGLLLGHTALASAPNRIVLLNEENSAAFMHKIAAQTKESTAPAYITSNSTFVDSLTGGVLAAETEGGLFFYEELTQSEEAMAELSGSEAVILGGTSRVSEELQNALGASRVNGENRYATATQIAEQLGTDRNLVIINGEKYPDALSATAYAAEFNRNILLVREGELPQATREYLETFGQGKSLRFIGGESSISTAVKQEVLDILGYEIDPDMLTLAGENRYETSYKVAKEFRNPEAMVFAEGDDFSRTILASVFAADKRAPVVLVRDFSDLMQAVEAGELELTSEAYITIPTAKIDLEAVKKLIETHQAVEITDLEGNPILIESLQSQDLIDNLEGPELPVEPKEPAIEKPVQPDADQIDKGNQTITLKDGTVRRIKQVIIMSSTSYDASPESNGPWGPITALGTNLRPGVVAVDPTVIPLGTEVYVVSNDDWPTYGMGIAEDTGGAIKGNKIDLFYESRQTVLEYGRREVTVYVLEPVTP
ncbi:MAG: cell wall-binding repeat-containing protein [Tissierellia bacterium]|nr:cell wall-binding repeat-containing protein [Tissierellia bacterium]